jgi:hypothetical protein
MATKNRLPGQQFFDALTTNFLALTPAPNSIHKGLRCSVSYPPLENQIYKALVASGSALSSFTFFGIRWRVQQRRRRCRRVKTSITTLTIARSQKLSRLLITRAVSILSYPHPTYLDPVSQRRYNLITQATPRIMSSSRCRMYKRIHLR